MSRASMENSRVKKEIINSFFNLLAKKQFSEITVTDIVKNAGVARASYYRNFSTKEAIIEEYMNSFYDLIMKDIDYDDDENIFNKNNVLDGFERALSYCMVNKSYILSIYNNGFGSMIQDIFNNYIEYFAGNMPQNSIEQYKLYFISGAMFNVLIQWLKKGTVESPNEISKVCVSLLEGGIVI